jgi:hypothetical protein
MILHELVVEGAVHLPLIYERLPNLRNETKVVNPEQPLVQVLQWDAQHLVGAAPRGSAYHTHPFAKDLISQNSLTLTVGANPEIEADWADRHVGAASLDHHMKHLSVELDAPQLNIDVHLARLGHANRLR